MARRPTSYGVSSAKTAHPSARRIQSHSSQSAYNSRNRLRGVHKLKYANTFLTQDRVEQKFNFDFDSNPDYDDYDDIAENQDQYQYKLQRDDFVDSDDIGVQLELPLQSIDELEGELSWMIRKYRTAISRMAGAALLWDDLMEDLEDDPHLDGEFKKFQMLRKLKGGQL